MANVTYDSTIIVTGGTVGLGYECALAISKQRPRSRIIISSRSPGAEAAAKINTTTGQNNVIYKRLDLADLTEARAFANDIVNESYPPVTALVLNAGIQIVSGITYTKQNIETTFGVNHVGHALLFFLLIPHLAPDARIVLTASGVHDPKQRTGLPDAVYQTAELLAHPDQYTIKNDGRQRYSTSKLCNVLWIYALERRRVKASWTVNAMDPGLMPGTGLARDANVILRFLWHHVLPYIIPVLRLLVLANTHTPYESGQNLARLAISPEVEGVSGKYFEAAKPVESSKDSYDVQKQDDLWRWTVETVSRDQREKERFERLE